jgi:integrase
MAIKVKLRQKAISGNRLSLYLDFYPAIIDPETRKQTRRQFLNLFLFADTETTEQVYKDDNGKEQKRIAPVLDKKGKPKKISLNLIDRQHNKETLQIAESIRQKRDNQLNKPEIYTGLEKEQLKAQKKGKLNFVEYFEQLTNKRKASNHNNWVSTLHYLTNFTGGQIAFADLDEKFCNDFREYLLSTPSNKSKKVILSQNSVVSYYNKLKAALKQAYKDGYIVNDLRAKITSVKPAETQRNFLTLQELNKLVKADCQNPQLKTAGIFAALTGLRFSDIQKLSWGEIEYTKGQGYTIRFTQQKTKGVETLPIAKQALELLGKRRKPTDKVFEGLHYSAHQNKLLTNWVAAAGITKKITFHCFRHTYATLQLSAGTDIYTVSKMLGHRELKTTQQYTKVIDQAKRAAANKITLNL